MPHTSLRRRGDGESLVLRRDIARYNRVPTEEELAQMELDRSVAAKFAEGWEPSGEDEDDAAALGIPLDKWVAWKDFQAEMAAREEAEHAAESEEVAALQADQAEVTE